MSQLVTGWFVRPKHAGRSWFYPLEAWIRALFTRFPDLVLLQDDMILLTGAGILKSKMRKPVVRDL